MIVEDTLYVLKNRRKGNKLSHDQIKFLKKLCKNSNIAAKKNCKAHNISLSVLHKIKRKIYEEVNKKRVKNYV